MFEVLYESSDDESEENTSKIGKNETNDKVVAVEKYMSEIYPDKNFLKYVIKNMGKIIKNSQNE